MSEIRAHYTTLPKVLIRVCGFLSDNGTEDEEADGGDEHVEDVEVVVLLVPPGSLKVLNTEANHLITSRACKV